MKLVSALVLGVCVSLTAVSAASADVQITMRDGRVSIVAKDATLRQILAEWAKVGQTKILNAERVPGPPLTLQLTNVPEHQALDTLLRTLSGYVASPRAETVSNLSVFDRIAVIPTPAAVTTTSANNPPPPSFPQVQPTSPLGDDQQDAPIRAPVFQNFPPPQVGNQMPPNMPTPAPGVMPPPGPLVLPQEGTPAAPGAAYPGAPAMPGGSAVPGMIVPAPKRPGGGGQ